MATGVRADMVAHFPMDLKNGQITESISGQSFDVGGNFAPENVAGAEGKALRFDGYTSYVDATLGNILAPGNKKMTFSAWVALPCYPIIEIDRDTNEKTAIVSCLDDTAKKGFGFFIGFNGKYSFRSYVSGWAVDINVDTPLQTYQWVNLTAVVDCDARTAKLYNNGIEVGSSRCTGSIEYAGGEFYMGMSAAERFSGPFQLMAYNGLVDEIKIWNEAIPSTTIAGWKAKNEANLDIPSSRFEYDILRPRFHGMPAAAWTNECHGMTYSNGRYHLFFQKNANGPYMARLHWGHISSENLYDWREEPIAIAPGTPYDIKGCWSGCVFTDQQITGGKPNIIYTGVDYARASIDRAVPQDENLIKWEKWGANPLISMRPDGLSDDFRDPYFFRNGNDAYIIVGTSKNGVGACTLHKYQANIGSWTNDGKIFFQGNNVGINGKFWEMPNITKMENGKWLCTATPLATSNGVKTLYWTGDINADGTFAPDNYSSTPRQVELISKEGFGLLSPTIFQHQGKTIALGIVPDKLASISNWTLGWAHCYSLPREWSLDQNGNLIQKPWSELAKMRTNQAYTSTETTLNGTIDLSPVSGRQIELTGNFVVGNSDFGFNIFKNSSAFASITISPSSRQLTADFSKIERLGNDGNVYNGIYSCQLPFVPVAGEEIKLNVFVDHSIVDIFINDRYATSIRVFPTDENASGVEAFGNGNVKNLGAWALNVNASGVENITTTPEEDPDALVDVYSISGVKLKSRVSKLNATDSLPRGIYIVGNKKVSVL